MSVVVIGDANVDLEIQLPAADGTEVRGNPDPRLFAGGSAANTAAALGKLEIGCRFVGSVGDDSYGRFAVASLRDAGVEVDDAVTTADDPTVMVILAVTPTGERLVYVWPPAGGAHAALTVDEAVRAVAGAEWLHVSGICLRVSPAREAVLEAMARARRDGVPVSFDLNLRLENWGWDGDFRDVVEAAVDRADVVMGAAIDEIAPLAQMTDPVAAARLLAGDERTVIARLGAGGAVACSSSSGVVRSPGFAVTVADTVGAGDAFDAGFIAGRVNGSDLSGALRMANGVAALSVTRAGARATPTLDELEQLLSG